MTQNPTSTPPAAGPADRPAGASIHPALAQPPRSAADRGGRLDTVVFGISAALALAFVAWGFLSPSGLGSASGSALTWIETNLG
ncbi:hypothetical protein SAMN05660485_03846, partial [Blastococcus fimeti]